MSKLVVEICKVEAVEDAPGSDRLSNIRIKGWNVVSSKLADGSPRYEPGSKLVYLPPDVVLSEKLITYLFPEGEEGRIKPPSGGRLKAIKIRGNISYGMSIDITPELEQLYPGISNKKIGEDVTSLLEVRKWEPPEPPVNMRGDEERSHPDFKKYLDVENIKNYDRVLIPGEEVSACIKIHGSNIRVGLFTPVRPSIWQKLKSWVTKKPLEEFCVGSRNKRVKAGDKTYYSDNIYVKVANQYDLRSKLRLGEELIGEVYGPSVQKGFSYGLKPGELRFLAFDLIKDGRYLDRDEFVSWCEERQVPRVPEVYRGPFSMEVLEKYSGGKDHPLDLGIPCREGIVIRPVKHRMSPTIGNIILKQINPAYYSLKDTTDYH